MNSYGISDHCAEKRSADRGFIGDLSLDAVRLGGSDDLIRELLVKLNVIDLDLAADHDMVRRDILFVNDFDVLEDLLQVFDPGFDITLFVLGCIVFGVLREVALLSRFLDLLRYFFSSNNLEFVKLVLISLEAPGKPLR